MSDMDEFKVIFFTECAELLVDMEERLVQLDTTVSDKEALNAIFRCAHSIKGGSGAFGMNAIMGFTHSLEALLDIMRSTDVPPTREAIDVLLKSADVVTKMLEMAKQNQEPPADFGADVLAAIKALTSGGAPTPLPAMAMPHGDPSAAQAASGSATPSYHIKFAPYPELFATANEPLLLLRELAKLGQTTIAADIKRLPEIADLKAAECYIRGNITLVTDKPETAIWDVFEFVAHVCDLTVTKEAAPAPQAATAPAPQPAATAPVAQAASPPAAAAAPAKPAEAKKAGEEPAKAAAATSSIRVDLEKVDRLVNMVGELVITEAMIRAQVRHLAEDQFADLLRGVDELSQHTRELQEAVMAMRMQPVKSIFSRMPRIVRDTASQLGKDIQLVLSGENTEVDKTVIESLSDPLTHMIRNSCDHGIETPDQRVWNDKPLQGTIHLSAYHRSGRIIIEIADDGAGINRVRVFEKAKEKGIVAPDAQLSDEEIDHLIFHAGFSTAEKVTSVSGRGVGMDVVRRNIEALGGTVSINNRPGKGSTFTVSLPLTLAILDGMIVRVGKEFYVVPITSIIETLRPKPEQVHHVEGRGDVLNVRGEFLPLVYLHSVFGIKNAEHEPSKALTVLVESGAHKMGLVVDELVGQQQVVIKSLEANADPVKGISGATILGDGKVSLILEIGELAQLSQERASKLSLFKSAA
jgi:two-component system chemotaxis sensor kinase CheA